MDLRDYVRILRRRWLLVVGCCLAAIAVAALVTLRTTPLYSSEARLFVSTAQSDSAEAYQGGLFSQERVKSYADLLTGEEIASQVVDKLQLDETPRDLSNRITATVVPETVILTVSVTDTNPRMAQRISQAVAEQFSEYVTELETPRGQDNAPIKATIVDAATLPMSPVSPQPLRNLGLAAILGLLLGIGIAVLRETLDTTIKSPSDLETITETPLLGTITFDRDAVKHPLITTLGTHAPRTEAFRVLRTNLQFINVDQTSKVIVVTSSIPGEGKTTTAANLAITLAQTGQRVALIEGDLRRPRLAEYLRLETVVGVTTILIGKIDLEDAIQPWGEGDLAVLTSGAIPPNPSELLQTKAMSDLLIDLRSRYDVILIDAPPLLPVTDAALLAAQADGAVLVVRHGDTTRDQVQHAIDRLEGVGARLVGTVLNMTPTRAKNSYGYGYGYGYGEAPDAQTGRRRADKTPALQSKEIPEDMPTNAGRR